MNSATGVGHYQQSGRGYALRRKPDPRIAAQITAALGQASTVLNVGAGTGSYEPEDRKVVALEPSPVMIDQRKPGTACVRGVAGALPFADGSFAAAMATLTIHHWPDWRAGLAEMQRVAGRIVLLTHDTGAEPVFWLCEYLPQILEHDLERMPPIADLHAFLGGRVEPVPVPRDCTDGFLGAYWREPAKYLDPDVRTSMSAFALLSAEELETGLMRLETDLLSGEWDRRYGHLRERESIDIGYRLVIA